LHSEIVDQGCSSSISFRNIYDYNCKNWDGIEFRGYVLKRNGANKYEDLLDEKYIDKANDMFKNKYYGWKNGSTDKFYYSHVYYHMSRWLKKGNEGGKGGNGGKCGVSGKEGYVGELILAEKRIPQIQIETFNKPDKVKPNKMSDCSGNPGLGGQNGDSAIKYYEYHNNPTVSKIFSLGLVNIGTGGNWVDGADET
jgi:hypothetical protein